MSRSSKKAIEPSRGIRGAVKSRIVNDMIAAVPGNFKVMICDMAATQIISSCMRMHELLDVNVTLVENITNVRQPVPSSAGIYFVAPTPTNIDLIIKDWEKVNMYNSAHIFFTSTAPQQLLTKFTGTRVVGCIKSLKDLLLDFSAPETVVYTLGWKFDLPAFFGPTPNMAKVGQAASQLVSILQALGEKTPLIRYQNSSEIAKTCAQRVNDNLSLAAQSISASQAAPEPGLVLIFDRTIDMNAPFLHDLHYQAMLNDLMPLKDNTYLQKYKDRTGKDTTRSVVIDEEDAHWCEHRHDHISTCLKDLAAAMKKLLEDNPELAGGMTKGNTSLSTLGNAVRNLPQFQAAEAKLSLHMDLVGKLYDLFKIQNLTSVCDLEQRMATGETRDGNKVAFKDWLKEMQSMMKEATLSRAVKFRLILVLIVTQGSQLSKDKRQELLQAAGLGAEENHIIDNLAFLGVDTEKGKGKTQSGSTGTPPAKGGTKDDAFELSRYEGALKLLVDQAIKDTLNDKEYPYVKAPAAKASGAQAAAGGAGKSLRAANPKFAASLKGGGSSSEFSLNLGHNIIIPLTTQSRVIVFVMGGIMDAEVRGMYELIESNKREIICGATSIISPAVMLEEVPLLA